MANELKPFPFCGGEAELKQDTSCWGHGEFIKEYFVRCRNCGAKAKIVPVYELSQNDAIFVAKEAWNRRWNE